jgi:hypothetical protein
MHCSKVFVAKMPKILKLSVSKQKIYMLAIKILWHTDPLLGNELEPHETMATARQQLHKHTTVLEQLLGSSPGATTEVLLEAVFSMDPLPRPYHLTN